VLDWVRSTFGEKTCNVEERVLRFLEEAIELAQAEDIPIHRIIQLAEYVYGKQKGDFSQEVGGIGITLLAYCELRGISSDAEELREWLRISTLDPDHFRQRQNVKAGAGVAVLVDEAGMDTELIDGQSR
jgi:hypothetical protein